MKYKSCAVFRRIGWTLLLFGVLFCLNIIDAHACEECDGQYGREELEEQFAIQNAESIYENSINKQSPRSDKYIRKNGIDVSKYQGDINWNEVKASGVDFAFIRVGYRGNDGNLYEDEYYKRNLDGATAAGIQIGVYIYSEAISEQEAFEEADFLIARISGYNVQLPVVMDYEYCSGSRAGRCRLIAADQDMATRTQIVKAFCFRCSMWGYQGCVYANKYTLTNILDGDDIARNYKVWVAQYLYENPDEKKCYSYYPWFLDTTYKGIYDFWQFSSVGTVVNGLSSTYVDMNFWYDDGSMQHINSTGIYVMSYSETNIKCGLVVNATAATVLEYRWMGYSFETGKWFVISDWISNNPWLDYSPRQYGDIFIVGQVRIPSQRDNIYQSTCGIKAHPYINGICQMPNPYPEGGVLIGISSYDNPEQRYSYELVVYDCSLGTWNYSTGKMKVSSGSSLWTVWKPRYGYYVTLFRVYDGDGEIIDEKCFSFTYL